MIYKVYKIILADMEKEENWINEMARKGFNFIDNVLMRYTFSDGEPNEYIYRIELLKNRPNHPESRQYIDFMKETGVECVSTTGRWAYFRKKEADGQFDLYSDIDEKIQYYKRNINYVFGILLLNLMVLGINLVIAFTRKLPANFSISITILVFTVILVRTIFHYVKKVRGLKKEQQVHE
jgi:hypothetical protein